MHFHVGYLVAPNNMVIRTVDTDAVIIVLIGTLRFVRRGSLGRRPLF